MSNSLDFEKPIEELEKKISELEKFSKLKGINLDEEIAILKNKVEDTKKEIYRDLSSWDKVRLARLKDRPNSLEYISKIFDSFIELHGDRQFADDKSIVGGIGLLDGSPITIIGHQKGRDTKENIMRNFGMPYPEGYRKALRLMKQAEKFNRPLITFIDTPGAYCGIGAEERGQGEAIALNLLEMSRLKIPIVVVIIGEGGSGGALALGVGDKIAMLSNSIYSVITPEGLASILWKDSKRAKEVSEHMKMTSKDLLNLEIIDDIIEEPLGGAHKDIDTMSSDIKNYLIQNINLLKKEKTSDLLKRRYEKIRDIGLYHE